MLSCKIGNDAKFFFVNWGYAECGAEKVLILADSAELSEEIDIERARAAMKRAEERLGKAEHIDFHRAELALERAIIRVQLGELKKVK
jgi:F-type H+-transporting ATPase subunit epsilon